MKRNLPCRLGEIHTIDITALGHSGEGVGRINGFTVFVPGALQGEIGRASCRERV